MKKKGIPIVFVTVGLILIGIGILMAGTMVGKKIEKDSRISEKEVSEYIEKLTNTLIYGGTRAELIEVLQVKPEELMESDSMSGPDMYLRQLPDKNVIGDNDISAYKKAGETYASNLEKRIQDNLEYNVEGISDGGDYWAALVSYRSYYYQAYINDLSQLQIELLSLSGYMMDGSNVDANNEFKLASYKARIKAAEILDSHLDDYVNPDTTNKVYINFKNKTIAGNSEDFLSYMMNLSGYAYSFQGNILTGDQARQYLVDSGVNLDSPLDL